MVLGNQPALSGDSCARFGAVSRRLLLLLVTAQLAVPMFAGKAHAVDVFEVLARDEEGSQMQRQLCAEFALALKSLEAERWTEAIDRLTAVLDAFPNDGPARFHLERCRRWCAEPALSDPAGIVCIDAK